MKPILIVETGAAVGPRTFGGLFGAVFSELGRESTVVRPHEGEPFSPVGSLAGVLVTGSPASVTDPDPWIGETGGWLLGAAGAGVPVLGVCFGHQLLADAFGGRVEKNPRGRELGTVEVALTPEGRADPLFEGLPDTLVVQQSHQDIVVEPPPGAVRLASNAHCAEQAFSLGALVRAVQFHPELDEAATLDYIDARAPADQADALRRAVRELGHGRRILGNWVRRFVEG